MADWNRQMEVVGPQTYDTTIAGYTTAWSFGNLPFVGNVWRAIMPPTPDSTPPGTSGRWQRLMQPMRFKLSGGGFTLQKNSFASESASPSFGGAVLTPPIFRSAPPSSVGPPLSGHFKRSRTKNLSVSLPFGAWKNYASRIRFLRVLVDDVDVSGLVALSGAIAGQSITNSYFNAGSSNAAITTTDVADKTIEVDIWLEVDVTVGVSGFDLNAAAWAFNGTMGGRYGNVVPHYVHFIRGINALNVNAKRATTRPYRFQFSSAISGGTTQLSTVSQANPWTLIRDDNSLTFTHTGLNDSVRLIYGQEIAELILTQKQQHAPFGPGVWYYRYVPNGTGDYGAMSGGISPGIFNPDGSQSFVIAGYNSIGSGNPDDWNTVIPAILPWCPATITVSPP